MIFSKFTITIPQLFLEGNLMTTKSVRCVYIPGFAGGIAVCPFKQQGEKTTNYIRKPRP